MTEGVIRLWEIFQPIPAIRVVRVRIPQAARFLQPFPARVHFFNRVAEDEDFVLDDNRKLAATGLDEIRQSHVTQVAFKIIADDIAGCDAGIRVDARDADCMIVVPQHTRALVVGIEILGLVLGSLGIEHVVIEEALAMMAMGVPPAIRSAVADPRHKPTMQMH